MDNATAFNEYLLRLRSRNEALERERDNVPGPPDIRPVFMELLTLTCKIHAGWLLLPCGKRACKELSLGLDSKQPGWEDLASKLGLRRDMIQDIRLNPHLGEGPTHVTLRIYAERKEATVGEVITKLNLLQRYDLILCLKDSITGENGLLFLLQDEIRLESTGLNESGYISGSDTENSLENIVNGILKPTLPPLPNKYREFDADRANRSSGHQNGQVEREILLSQTQHRHLENHPQTSLPQSSCGRFVMLTFAMDGISCAERLAAALRMQREGRPRIDVLVLDEYRKRVVQNPSMFINGCFPQVHYIVPILTQGYLDAVAGVAKSDNSFSACLDARYVKLIYTLMSTEYVNNGCLNRRVRCIVPNGSDVLRHPALPFLPELQVWLPEDDIEHLAEVVFD